MIQRGHLKDTAHLWADGCGAQNKGRKSFRQFSELSAVLCITIFLNFPSTAHFAGPWDTEGGRQTRAVRNHVLNERETESVLDAGDNVRLLRSILNKAGQPDKPIQSQKMWRPSNASLPAPHDIVVASKAKRQRQLRGRTEAEAADDDTDEWYCVTRRHIYQVEPCECVQQCSCPEDGRLTYKRNEKYDCTAIPGTLSTYCYAFNRKALHVEIRQYSCYCRWCSTNQFQKCINLHVVRHDPDHPVKTFDSGYTRWRDMGWRKVVLSKLRIADPAVTRLVVQSRASALEYVKNLPIGTTIAIMTKKSDGSSTFWLASKQSETKTSRRNENNTGIKKNEKYLDVIWYDRLTTYKYLRLDDIVHVSVSSVLVTVFKITWLRTTTNRYYLGEHTHNKLQELVDNISEHD